MNWTLCNTLQRLNVHLAIHEWSMVLIAWLRFEISSQIWHWLMVKLVIAFGVKYDLRQSSKWRPAAILKPFLREDKYVSTGSTFMSKMTFREIQDCGDHRLENLKITIPRPNGV